MSNEIKLAILACTKRLADLSQYADELASKIAREAVERHHDFYAMCNKAAEYGGAETAANLRGYVADRGELYAEADWEMKNGARSIEATALNICGELHAVVSLVTSTSDDANARIGQALRAKENAELQARQMAERLKEHALNDADVREKVWAITGGACFYCDVALVRGAEAGIGHPQLFHIDHLVPRSLGGPDHLANYVPACGSCNSSKHARHFAEFVMSRKAKPEQPLLTVIEGGAA